MAMQNNNLELAQVVKKFGKSLLDSQKISPQQTKALFNIINCRTAVFGGHEDACDSCGVMRYSYNSCGDRHCPKCQHPKQVKWIDKLQADALPVKHYHVIFTLPHCLNDICLWNDKLYYNQLFKAVWETLRSFGYTHYGVESGAIAILHTWGQNLSLHPHIHCIVPAAGVTLKGQWKHIGNDGKYLYPVRQLSAAFKGKFLDAIKRKLKKVNNHSGFTSHLEKAYKSEWVVYCEAPLTGVYQVIKYLGQYTHRIAISNQRIKSINKSKVFFHAKDYRDNATVKLVSMKGEEFLRRFVQHILPKGFVRIRRFGIYHHCVKRSLNLQFDLVPSAFDILMQQEKEKEKEKENRTIIDAKQHNCPICKTGTMITIRELPRIRSPAGHLPSKLRSYLD